MKKNRRFVDSRFVKTCDEFVTRQQNFQLRLFDICNMLMEIWMLAHLTNDKKMVYYIKLIVNFLIMSFDFGEINLNLHLHSIQRTIFLSGQGNLLFKGYWQESYIFLNFCNTLKEQYMTSDVFVVFLTYLPTLISLINVELGINVEGVQKLPNC